MRVSPKSLERMLRDEYLDAAERLRIWTEVTQEELQDEKETREEVYAMMFWSQTEFHRRREYLYMTAPEVEREGAAVLRQLMERRRAEAKPETDAPGHS